MCLSSLKMHMAHSHQYTLFIHSDKERLSTLWFSGTLHWTTWSVNIAHCSCLKKKFRPQITCQWAKKSTHPFPNSVQNVKFYVSPRLCQRILPVEIKHMISNVTWKDRMLKCCSLVIKKESSEYENVPRNGFSITRLELTTTIKAGDHDNYLSRKSVRLLRIHNC